MLNFKNSLKKLVKTSSVENISNTFFYMTFFTFCISLPSPNVYSFAAGSFFINSKVFLQCVFLRRPPLSTVSVRLVDIVDGDLDGRSWERRGDVAGVSPIGGSGGSSGVLL